MGLCKHMAKVNREVSLNIPCVDEGDTFDDEAIQLRDCLINMYPLK